MEKSKFNGRCAVTKHRRENAFVKTRNGKKKINENYK